ncbi:MAG: hypothetical protein K5978_03620 [Campylobacter sp.]|nr:hypothetical protein [Campylobacter sp.]
MNDITVALFIAILAGAILYMQIQKITKNIDQKVAYEQSDENKFALLRQNSQKYINFCDAIDENIRDLRALINDGAAKNDECKDKILSELSEISKKLAFLQSMNQNASPQSWENSLFEILSKIDNLVNENLNDADEINEKIRENLREHFENM